MEQLPQNIERRLFGYTSVSRRKFSLVHILIISFVYSLGWTSGKWSKIQVEPLKGMSFYPIVYFPYLSNHFELDGLIGCLT